MEGQSDGNRTRRRAAAPVYDAAAGMALSRSSRSSTSAAVDEAAEVTISPSRTRPTRISRISLTRRAAAQPPSSEDVADADPKPEIAQEDISGAFEWQDGDGEADVSFVEQGSQRQTRTRERRATRQPAASQPSVAEESAVPVRRASQRSAATLKAASEPTLPPASLSPADVEETTIEEEENRSNVRVSIPLETRRSARRSGQSSPRKAVVTPGVTATGQDALTDDTTMEDSDTTQQRKLSSAAHKGRSSRVRSSIDNEDDGYMEDADNADVMREVYLSLIAAIRAWLTKCNLPQLTSFLEQRPTRDEELTLTAIHARAGQLSGYPLPAMFDKALMQLFRSARRYFDVGSYEYGGAVTLQRMYQHMTQSIQSALQTPDDEVMSRNYASIRYGPCQEGEGEGSGYGESTSTGEKVDVRRLVYKGMTISIGDWVHLSNPTDPARPIVALIYKTRTEDLGDDRQDWITANWFVRPEQSRHPRSMTFWENEVIKTSQLIEHHVEDVLEVVKVLFYTKASRGHPIDGDGGWHTGDPLYLCEIRYQDNREAFFKIKNWASCLPDEMKNRRDAIIESDQPIALPPKLESPLLRGVSGPGAIIKERAPLPNPLFAPTGRKVAAVTADVKSIAPPLPRRRATKVTFTRGRLDDADQESDVPVLFNDWRNEVQVQRHAFLQTRVNQRAPSPSAGASATPALATMQGQSPGQAAPSPGGASRSLPPQGASTSPAPPLRIPLVAPAIDRTLNGTLSQMDIGAYFKSLPEDTQRLFQQDPESGTVVWYSAPPVVVPTKAAEQRRWNDGERFQAHSLDYLYHMASEKASGGKRKQASVAATKSMASTSAEEPRKATRKGEGTGWAALSQNMIEVEFPTADSRLEVGTVFARALRHAADPLSRHIEVDGG